jgi:hypothetical protein
MTAIKPEVEITASDGTAIPTYTPICSAMPDSDMTLSTLPDVALPKFKMAVAKTGIGNNV